MSTSTIISIVISILSLIGVPTIMSFVINKQLKKAEKIREETHELKAAEAKRERINEIKTVMYESVKPLEQRLDNVDDKISNISKDIDLSKAGTLSSLRYNIVELYNTVRKRGYKTDVEKETFEKMYQAYHNLGGNHYVDELKEEFRAVPDELEHKSRKKKATKSAKTE
jgi:lipopolysaccharide export LptBFGC system permease protein LptF